MAEKKLTLEELLERWKQFASEKYQNPDVLMLSAEYHNKFECGQSLEMPAQMAFDHKPHIIG